MTALALTGAYLQHQRILARSANGVAISRGARAAATFVTIGVLAFSIGGGVAEIGRCAVLEAGSVGSLTPWTVHGFLVAWIMVTLGAIGISLRELG